MAKRYDWEAIEADYSAGMKSVSAIAREHGLTEGAIRKRAKKHGWQRDLSKSVRSAAQAKLVRGEGTTSETRTDSDIIDEASDEITRVVMGHRQDIREWRGIAKKLAATLTVMELDASNHDKYARSLNAGIDALGKAIKLERQSYGMDSEGQGDTPHEDALEALE